MFEKIAEVSLLYDFYGQLLSKRQREVMELYHEENLTLSEIAEEFSISRQGVHDALKNAEKTLMGYEEKLGLVAKFEETREVIEGIDSRIDEIIEENPNSPQLIKGLMDIKGIIDKLEE